MNRNYLAIEKSITETGFFSEYLPPCFSLNPKVFLKVPPQKCDLIAPYSFSMSRYNNNDARRNIFIPEIGSYVVVTNYIRQKHIIRDLIEFTEDNEASFSPILGNDDTIMRHEQSYDVITQLAEVSQVKDFHSEYIENISKKIIKATGAKKVLMLDISNCFSSFYMHMIPSIMLGMEEAEINYNKYLKNKNDYTIVDTYHRYRILDEVIRQQNLCRTNGLLSGPIISKIIAEGILTRIDSELIKEDIKFSRYVDDYEVYLFNDEDKRIISIFTRVLKRYGFTLNNEKTKLVDFPYYIAENLEKFFRDYTSKKLDNTELMELFNTFFKLEKNGVKGAIRFLIKKLESISIEPTDISLYKAYLISIIENNERSLTKACSLLIKNKNSLILDENEIKIVKQMLARHIVNEHDLEVIWILFLLIEIDSIQSKELLVQQIISGTNDLAKIILLRKGILVKEEIDEICSNALSWILVYELYSYGYIDDSLLMSKLNLNKNLEMYQFLKQNDVHFCS